jgi:hypothetical protein
LILASHASEARCNDPILIVHRGEAYMRAPKLIRLASAVLLAGASVGTYAAIVSATASAGSDHHGGHSKIEQHHRFGLNPHGHPSVQRFNLDGYVLDTNYTLGRNTGNTFEQTYTGSSVQGVPIAGPNVGVTFPPEQYVAMPIGHHELYVAWLDPTQGDALVDVFVMNFKTHVVFDYAPGSLSPESSGTVKVVKRGAQPLP